MSLVKERGKSDTDGGKIDKSEYPSCINEKKNSK